MSNYCKLNMVESTIKNGMKWAIEIIDNKEIKMIFDENNTCIGFSTFRNAVDYKKVIEFKNWNEYENKGTYGTLKVNTTKKSIRLTYNQDTQKLLEQLTEDETCYWRYQDSEFGGIVPRGYKSHERIVEGNKPVYMEKGASCYDNPLDLLKYMSNEYNDLDTTDVVLFVGKHMGYGLDDEDIVRVERKSDNLYSLSLRNFYEFCNNADVEYIKNYMTA